MSLRLRASSPVRASFTYILALYLFSTQAFAQTEKLRVEMTNVTPITIMQGEPTVLHYVITNNSNQQMSVDMGTDGAWTGTEWVSPSMTAADGTAVPTITNPNPIDPGGLHFSTLYLGPNSQKTGEVVFSRWFSIPYPGTYTLTVRVNLPYRTWVSAEAEKQGPSPEPSGFTQDFTFPLTVTTPNPQHLQALATSLEQAAIQAKDARQQVLLIQELASLPEAQAWSRWVKLMKDDPSLNNTLATELGRRPTKRTLDLLAQINWPAKKSAQFHGYSANNELLAIYDQSTGALKEYIRQIYANHGVDLTKPNQVFRVYNGG